MRTKKFLSMMLLAVLAAALAGAIFQNQRLKRARANLADGQRKVVELQRELGVIRTQNEEAARSLREIEGECAVLQKQIEARSVAKPGAITKNKPQSMQNWSEQTMQMTGQDAEYQKAFLQWTRLGYGVKYARLYKSLGLSRDQIVRLEDLIQTRDQATWDVIGAAQGQGLNYKDPAIEEMIRKARGDATQKIKDQLGADGYKAFVKASGTTLGGIVTKDVVAKSLYSDSPMTIEQADKLEALINRCRDKNSPKGEIIWDDVLAQSETLLAPTQLAFLKTQRELRRLGDEMHAMEQKAAAAQ